MKKKFDLNNDSLQNVRISKARLSGYGNQYFKTLVFPERREMILLDDAIKILKGKLKSVQTYKNYSFLGNMYSKWEERSISRYRTSIRVGCQRIDRKKMKELKKVLRIK